MIRSDLENNTQIKSEGVFSRSVVQLIQDTAHTCYERYVPVYVWAGQEYMCDWFLKEFEEEHMIFGL